jgi:CRISPR-associated protein Cas1
VLPSSYRDTAINQLAADARVLAKKPPKSVPELLGIEGRSAPAYFRAWHEVPIRWKGTGRHPIPEDWRQIGPRGSRRLKNSNRFTAHPAHAMLNYGYAVMESQVRIAAIKSGLDPTIGFLHQYRYDRPDRPELILDIMEPMRADVDRRIVGFVQEETFSPADFQLARSGICRLHPQLARRVVGLVSQVEGVSNLIGQLIDMLHYRPKKRPPHRSKAWLEEQGWTSV